MEDLRDVDTIVDNAWNEDTEQEELFEKPEMAEALREELAEPPNSFNVELSITLKANEGIKKPTKAVLLSADVPAERISEMLKIAVKSARTESIVQGVCGEQMYAPAEVGA